MNRRIELQLQLIKLGYQDHLGPTWIEKHLKKIEYFTEQKWEIQGNEDQE